MDELPLEFEQPTLSKLDACADQQRLWCDLAGRGAELECWNHYFDWCAPEPRLQVDNVDIRVELQERCMTDLLETEPAPLNHWLPDMETIPASCRTIWAF